MKVDYHFHLEEGPYSPRWWGRTADALWAFVDGDVPLRHSKEWINQTSTMMATRLQEGPYSRRWFDLYLERAKQLGLQQVGVVDHLYRFVESRSYFDQHVHVGDDRLGRLQQLWLDQVVQVSVADYVMFVEEQKTHWADEGVELRLGIEADYFIGGESWLASFLSQHPWDYIIGSVHFIDGWGFDNPQTQDRFKEFDLPALYHRFFETVEQAIRSGLFDIVAHLDNLKVFGYRPAEEEILPLYKKIARALYDKDVATEINTGLRYRYPVKEACPSPAFLKVLGEQQVKITMSSDAHFPDDLGRHSDESLALLLTTGYQEVATFQRRIRSMVHL